MAQLQKPGRCKILEVVPGRVGKMGFEQRSQTSFNTTGCSPSALNARYRIVVPNNDYSIYATLSTKNAITGVAQSGDDITELV